MTAIVFRPWQGERFDHTADGVRLLLLGESFYGEPDKDRSQATSIVVENWRSGEWNVRYLNAAARLLTGKESWEVDRKADLNPVAFHNLVQVEMQSCGDRPTSEQARASWPAFREVLATLAPTHILATGKFVWENLPEFDGAHSLLRVGETLHEVGEYATLRGFALAMAVPHLSRYFSPPKWRPVLQAFLALRELPAD